MDEVKPNLKLKGEKWKIVKELIVLKALIWYMAVCSHYKKL